MCESKCVIEVPPSITTQLNATITATLLEVPAFEPSNIINHDQEYVVRVCMELGSSIKRILCGEWCVNLGVESCGPAKEFRLSQVILMDNCNDAPDCVEFRIRGRDFENADSNHCGDLFQFCVTVIARDACANSHKPIGIAGFCKLGPVMVY